MRVLVISHTVFCETTNMGKTLMSYFREFAADEIAQLYIHSELPINDSVCRRYFRITDKDMLVSRLSPNGSGREFTEMDIRSDLVVSRTDAGLLRALYRLGERRTALIYALRNLVWRFGRWKTDRLKSWVSSFSPDIVFFASGDYAFMYDIAREIAEYANAPLVVACVDDYYLHNRNEDSLLGRFVHSGFMKTVRKTMARAEGVFVICESMAREYESIFGKSCMVLHTSVEDRNLSPREDARAISYIGNLEYGRHHSLLEIGRALKSLGADVGIEVVDVYSAEENPEILKDLTPENGVRFYGRVSPEGVLEVMRDSLAVLHVESFDEKTRKIVRFSVSTKIAESLMYGPCLIAYGPEEIASMEYLKKTGTAFMIGSPEHLEASLREVITNKGLRSIILEKARKTARINHQSAVNSSNVRKWLVEARNAWDRNGQTAGGRG